MSKTLKYLCMLIILLIISIIPNISNAVTKADINQHAWGGRLPTSAWGRDNYNEFHSYVTRNYPNINPDFFKNPLLGPTSPSIYHGPSLGSCATCNSWRQQSGDFLTKVFNSGTRGLVSGTFPFIRNTIEYQAGVNYHMYCIEHSGAFGDEHWLLYTNTVYMRIEGNYLTQVTKEGGQTTYPNTASTSNGRLAYLGYATPDTGFNQTDGKGHRYYGGYGALYISNGQTVGYTESQKTMWAFINQWYSDVGKSVGIDYTDTKNNDLVGQGYVDPSRNSLYKKALDYANNLSTVKLSDADSGKDNTNKNNIKVETYNRNGEQWVKVGPFKWTFSGTMDSVTVTANSGTVSNVLILSSDANTQIKANQIKSGTNFYITMKLDSNLTSITKVQGKFKLPDIITADVYIFKGDSTNIYTQMVLNNPGHSANRPFQKTMLIVPKLEKPEGTVETDLTGLPGGGLPVTISFSIEKVDKDNNSIKLPNVGFKFYNNEEGKYIKNNGTTFEYVNTIEEATEYITDNNGKIEVKNVPGGTYKAYETKNPDKAYDVNTEPTEIKPTNGVNIKIENEIKNVSIVVEKVDQDDTSIKLEGVGFKFYNEDKGKYLKLDGNNEFVEYVNTIGEATEVKTDKNGQVKLNYIPVGKYRVYETAMPNKGYDLSDEPIEIQINKDTTNVQITNELKYISIEIEKVDENDNSIKLEGVGFKFYNVDDGKYIRVDRNNEFVEYVNTIEEATEVKTDGEGKIKLNYVPKGTYLAYETTNPNYGYVAGGDPYQIEAPKDTSVQLGNAIKYIKLTGTVWEDIQSEKMSKRNELYRLDANDDADEPLEGVKVTLKDKTTRRPVTDTVEGLEQGQVLETETYTDENGQYQFDYVPVDGLDNYYIEFEYDGLIYENVTPHLENEEKGSKAEEPGRQEFNNRFTEMEEGSGDLQAEANNGEANEPKVNYDSTDYPYGRELEIRDEDATNPERTENTEIVATTEETGYELEYDPSTGSTEITNINLGLYKRPQTDLALQTELQQIKAEINGYGHIYNYGPMYNVNNAQEVEDSWNLGIRYQSQYKGTYERPIYEADATYTNTKDPSEELSLSLTYKITIQNQGSVYGKVNEVTAYFDSRYNDEITGIGTQIDSNGNVKNTSSLTGQVEAGYNHNGYKKLVINTSGLNQIISYPTAPDDGNKVTEQSIYVQFKLSRDRIVEMLNEGDTPGNTLSFTAEIGSYTSYSDPEGKTLYAAYDIDSVPDNAVAGDETTYEDDTDKASQVALTIADARTISGYVFEDTAEENDENVAEGNGMFDEDKRETKLNNVKVELIDPTDKSVVETYNSDTDTWDQISYEVDKDGEYTISGFIPGEYQVRFTWRDGTTRTDGVDEHITVENYKSTIINNDVNDAYNALSDKGRFYLDENVVTGTSSLAVDDYSIRQQIDAALNTYTNSSDSTITEIPANTWTMNFPIEYNADELLSATLEEETLEATTDARQDTNDDSGHKITFPVNNINFGIIRRPEQNIELTKRVTGFKFTLPNGQVLIDAAVEEDGTLRGTTNYLSYVTNVDNPEGSVLRAEIDQNLIQGSTVEIEYALEIRNTSQADYTSEGYYNYGETYYEGKEADKRNDVVKFTSTIVMDYLDEDAQYDANSAINTASRWQVTNYNDNALIAESVKIELNRPTSKKFQLYQASNNIELTPEYYVDDTEINATVAELGIAVGQPVGNAQNANYINKAEVIQIVKTGGGKLTSTPGNYDPNTSSEETPDTDDTTSGQVVVLPSTGENRNYVLPISLIIIALVTLGVGIVIFLVKRH